MIFQPKMLFVYGFVKSQLLLMMSQLQEIRQSCGLTGLGCVRCPLTLVTVYQTMES